jgi:hypothetical protein
VRVDAALLCDAATVREGLLHILGGGATVVSRAVFPTSLGLVMAVSLTVDPDEVAGHHEIVVELATMDEGQALGRAGLVWEAQEIPSTPFPEIPLQLPAVVPLQLTVPRPGAYRVRLLIDDRVERELALLVNPTEEGRATS